MPSLNQEDRDLLKSAGGKVSTHAGIASGIGLGLGVYFAFRLRTMRMAYFRAFRAMEKPVEVRFADGRTGICTFDSYKGCTLTKRLQSLFPTSALPCPAHRAGVTPQPTSCSQSAACSWAVSLGLSRAQRARAGRSRRYVLHVGIVGAIIADFVTCRTRRVGRESRRHSRITELIC